MAINKQRLVSIKLITWRSVALLLCFVWVFSTFYNSTNKLQILMRYLIEWELSFAIMTQTQIRYIHIHSSLYELIVFAPSINDYSQYKVLVLTSSQTRSQKGLSGLRLCPGLNWENFICWFKSPKLIFLIFLSLEGNNENHYDDCERRSASFSHEGLLRSPRVGILVLISSQTRSQKGLSVLRLCPSLNWENQLCSFKVPNLSSFLLRGTMKTIMINVRGGLLRLAMKGF